MAWSFIKNPTTERIIRKAWEDMHNRPPLSPEEKERRWAEAVANIRRAQARNRELDQAREVEPEIANRHMDF